MTLPDRTFSRKAEGGKGVYYSHAIKGIQSNNIAYNDTSTAPIKGYISEIHNIA